MSGFDTLAYDTDQFGIQAAVHAKWNAAEDACEYKQTETPDPSYTSRHLLGEVVSLSSADRAQQASAGNVALVGVIPLIVVGIEALVVCRRGRRCYVRANVRCW